MAPLALAGLIVTGLPLALVAVESHAAPSQWIVLFGGASLDGWKQIGNANWTLGKDGIVQADTGNGFLVSTGSYRDFKVRVEFWTSPDANSGVYFRCEDPSNVTPANSYEANIFDRRPDPSYGTGAITDVAKIDHLEPVGGKWSVMEVTAEGSHLTVSVNGRITADTHDSRHVSGPIALQYFGGTVKFRKVEIRPLG